MRRPPRRKHEAIITRRLLYRVLFSASIIVAGTLFLYGYALSDEHMSRREQTMVRYLVSSLSTLPFYLLPPFVPLHLRFIYVRLLHLISPYTHTHLFIHAHPSSQFSRNPVFPAEVTHEHDADVRFLLSFPSFSRRRRPEFTHTHAHAQSKPARRSPASSSSTSSPRSKTGGSGVLVGTVSVSLVTQLSLVYVPFAQAIFQTEALDSGDLMTIVGLAGLSFALHEARRRYERHLEKSGTWAREMEEMA
jgi:magnesium-transporting ATPase (P-type)